MSLVRRQSPEEIKARDHNRFRRAALGVAACVAALFSIGGIAGAVINHEVNVAQEKLEDYMRPGHYNRDGEFVRPSYLRDPAPVPVAHTENITDWRPALLVGGGLAASFGGLVLLGAACKPKRDRGPGYDVATEEDFALYDFERTGNAAQDAMDQSVDRLVAGSTILDETSVGLEQDVNVALMCRRIESSLNMAHISVLKSMDGSDPLQALTYSSLSTEEQLAFAYS